MLAGQLNDAFIGHRLTVDHSRFTLSGRLESIEHGADLIEDSALTDTEPQYVIGNRWVDLQIGGIQTGEIDPSTKVVVIYP